MKEITETTNKKAVIYCRVSTKEQVEEGNSLVSQERLCREYALKEGYEVLEIFIEKGESAKTADRKELQRMLTLCTSKKDLVHAVIAYKVDRISRNIADYSLIKVRLKKFNVIIKSVTELFEDTPAGRFMENIIANVGQFDNEVRTERSVGGMREAVLEGRYVWMAPPGFNNEKINGKSTIKPNAVAPLVKEAFELVAQRKYSTEEVRLMVIKKGLVNSGGNPIPHSNFYLMLRNPLYKGKIKKFGKMVQGTFDPIVSEALFDDVQAILKGRKLNARYYTHDNPDFPLRRFVFSDEGKPLTGYWAQGRRLKYPYYSFTKANSTIRKEVLENKFAAFIDQYNFNDVHLKDIRKYLIKLFGQHSDKQLQNTGAIQKRIDEINTDVDYLINLERKGSISNAILEERTNKHELELDDLKTLLRHKENSNVDIQQVLNFAQKMLKNFSLLWQSTSSEIQKKLQWFEFPEGIVFDGDNFRTIKICSIFKLKGLLDSPKSLRVVSEYHRKNTVSKTILPPSDINLLETKEFWEIVLKELLQLEEILTGKEAKVEVEEECFSDY